LSRAIDMPHIGGLSLTKKGSDTTKKTNVSSESRFRSLSDPQTLARFAQNLGEGIYITNEQGEILDANPAFLKIFGVETLDELKSYNVSDFVDAEVRRKEVALVEKEGSTRDRELRITRPDGGVRTVLDTWYMNEDPETGEAVFHGILFDITGRKNLETQLVEQSIRDPLTGCYNRRHLATLYAMPRENSAQWGCVYVDIDHFKQYNDLHGHAAGDSVLVRMSRFLMRNVRAEEPVVRMGGDEFLVALFDTDLAETEAIAHRLEKAAEERGPVSFSLGWAARENLESLEETVNRADRELIQVRVIRRPETYTRRAPAEKD
ncbi:MAG TPA: sensor domain-containing diguanylate cyclase, partial [Gemmatimonadaceae bacterium]|nr:sensor domain-containing diguanylate cyclase [Gemmatimonadaceae bacterium]